MLVVDVLRKILRIANKSTRKVHKHTQNTRTKKSTQSTQENKEWHKTKPWFIFFLAIQSPFFLNINYGVTRPLIQSSAFVFYCCSL